MIVSLRLTAALRLFLIALPLAVGLAFPAGVSAHAMLLRSDPAQDAVLMAAPQRVRMWFSEDLNPALSTATVVNGENKVVDNRDAHISAADPREMEITLQPHLAPAVYSVIWTSDSADDGHVLRGSFTFSFVSADGTIANSNMDTSTGTKGLAGNIVPAMYMTQIDGPTLFNLIIITLVELAVVFWVGAQFWLIFVLRRASNDHAEQREINQQVQQHFEQRLSLPTLLILLLANTGVLVGQVLMLQGDLWGNVGAPFIASIMGLIINGRFGIFWMLRELIITLALLGVLYSLLFQPHSRFKALLPWLNLGYGLALLIAIAMSSHASATNGNSLGFALVVDYLHLLAAALWVGGMCFITMTYLPVLNRHTIVERAHSLVTNLPYYSPWALAGVALMAITGPFSATFHLSSWGQFITTTYGQALVIKILLVGALLITSAIHVLLLRPRLKKEHMEHVYAVEQLQTQQAAIAKEISRRKRIDRRRDQIYRVPRIGGKKRVVKVFAQQVKLCEKRLAKETHRLTSILRWEPMLGVGVLICVGLMNVFAGSLSPIVVPQQQKGQIQVSSRPFDTMVRTSDNKFTAMLNVSPNHLGTNIFTASVIDSRGKPTTDVGISLYITSLDMDMGTSTINLLPDGKGHFSSRGDFSRAGNWKIRIQIRTPDNTLHEAIITLLTPS